MIEFDVQAAAAYNRARFVFSPSLIEWVGRAASDADLTGRAVDALDIGEAFARLVHRAQTHVAPREQDGRLGPASIRAIRHHVGVQSRSIGLRRDGIVLPEKQVKKGLLGRYSDEFVSAHLGRFYVSGGFMEEHGHSMKGTTYAIFSDAPATIRTLGPSDRNLGVDYVVENPSKEVRAWYGGLVLAAGLAGGYGLRITVETDLAFSLAGEQHTVFQAYGHNAALHVKQGEFIEPGQGIATMGGTGEGGAVKYGEHVDLRTWITVDSKRVDLSPNVLDSQLPSLAPSRARVALPQLAIATLVLTGTAVLVWRART